MNKLLNILLLNKLSKEKGITPTGTINIIENGETDVTNYATANVNVYNNILPNRATTTEVNGLTFTVNSDLSITINGTATANTNFTLAGIDNAVVEILRLKANENYYSTTSVRLVYRRYDGDYGAINSGAFTPTTDIKLRHIYISVSNGTTMDNVTIYPQLIHGNKALPYKPYEN